MQNFRKIFTLATSMICEYQEQRPLDKVFFKYSSNKPNFIIEVIPNNRSEREHLVSFNFYPIEAFVALNGFYNYMAMQCNDDFDSVFLLLLTTFQDGEK